jgi:hypothetical protein
MQRYRIAKLKAAMVRQSSILGTARAAFSMELKVIDVSKGLGAKILSAVAKSTRTTQMQTRTRRLPWKYERSLEDRVALDEAFETV